MRRTLNRRAAQQRVNSHIESISELDKRLKRRCALACFEVRNRRGPYCGPCAHLRLRHPSKFSDFPQVNSQRFARVFLY